jgi:hypothetical protein
LIDQLAAISRCAVEEDWQCASDSLEGGALVLWNLFEHKVSHVAPLRWAPYPDSEPPEVGRSQRRLKKTGFW